MTLCENCLERTDTTRSTDVGPPQGTQRDPYRASIMLCRPCAEALIGGDMATLHDRYRDQRRVGRTEEEDDRA